MLDYLNGSIALICEFRTGYCVIVMRYLYFMIGWIVSTRPVYLRPRLLCGCQNKPRFKVLPYFHKLVVYYKLQRGGGLQTYCVFYRCLSNTQLNLLTARYRHKIHHGKN